MRDIDSSSSKDLISRRAFVVTSALAVAGLAFGLTRRNNAMAAQALAQTSKQVTLVEFSNSGKRLKTVKLAKIFKSEADWRKQLSPIAFNVTRLASTETAFTGKYWDWHDKGIYRCICCATALFDSATKFDSGTGWPSFWQPIARENVSQIEDRMFGMVRIAISCPRCDAHLGHVFDDGPEPTGMRYCMNSAALNFVKST